MTCRKYTSTLCQTQLQYGLSYEVIASCVSKRFGSKTDKEAISAQILEDHGAPDININNFVVPQINQTILMAPKVQNRRK